MSTSSRAPASPRRARVTVVGDACVEEHHDDRGSREFVGGGGVDAAIGLSVLGDEATLIAAVGDDEDGDRIRSVLRDYAVRLIPGPAAHGTVRTIFGIREHDGGTGVAPDPSRTAGGLRLDDEARRAIADADLIVVCGRTLTDAAGIDELIGAIERPELRLVVDGAVPAGMPRGRADRPADLERLSRRARFTVSGDGSAPRVERAVAAVAHLLAGGASPESSEIWDTALDAASATLAATALPGRTAPRPAPTDHGS